MPWDMSMLVLHPRISTETAGGPGGLVGEGRLTVVSEGSTEAITVGAVVAVMNGMGVEVAI
jgi:hypothetical protein